MRTLKESKWISDTRPRNAMEIQGLVQRPSKSVERFLLNAETSGSQVSRGKSWRRHFWLFFKATKNCRREVCTEQGSQPGSEFCFCLARWPSSWPVSAFLLYFHIFPKTELVALKCNQSYSPGNNLVTSDKISYFQKLVIKGYYSRQSKWPENNEYCP